MKKAQGKRAQLVYAVHICKHYNVPVIQLKDIKKQAGHPNIEGMKAIAQQVLEQVLKALR